MNNKELIQKRDIFVLTEDNRNKLIGLGMLEPERRNFVMNLGTIILNNPDLKEVNQNSLLNVALELTKLNLSVETATGYIVPYNTNKLGKIAQLIIGYKGYIELAMRTGLYSKIDCVEVKESDYINYDIDSDTYTWRDAKLTFQQVLDRKKEPIVGYRAFAILKTGEKLEFFMTMDEINKHHAKFSKAYKSKEKPGNVFRINKDQMDRKVVLKLFINRKLIKSINPNSGKQLIRALQVDSASLDKDQKPVYVDNPQSQFNLRKYRTNKNVDKNGVKSYTKSNENGNSIEVVDAKNIDISGINFDKPFEELK